MAKDFARQTRSALPLLSGENAKERSRQLAEYIKNPSRINIDKVELGKGETPILKPQPSLFSRMRRILVTDIAMAYRTAEYHAWQLLPFVVGQEIRLGKRHPVPDICDDLQGIYPKDFKFIGWHPWCRCFARPIFSWESEKVTEMPRNFSSWMERNAERIGKAAERGTLPQWISGNIEYLSGISTNPSKISALLDNYKAILSKRAKLSTNGFVAMDVTGGMATSLLKGFAKLINSYYEANASREKIAILRSIISDRSFTKLKYHSTKDHSIFAVGYESFDRQLRKGEMPKNLTMAKKLLPHGYDVYMLPNPHSNVSADFILRKGEKLFYAEGKTLNGKNSLDNRLRGGARQAERVLVDVIGTNDPRYIASTLKAVFEQNNDLSEVILLKGGREIKFHRKAIQSKHYENAFKKQWVKNK